MPDAIELIPVPILISPLLVPDALTRDAVAIFNTPCVCASHIDNEPVVAAVALLIVLFLKSILPQ